MFPTEHIACVKWHCSWSFAFKAGIVMVLQRLLQACEEELNSIDMVVNIKKSSCIVFKVYWLET